MSTFAAYAFLDGSLAPPGLTEQLGQETSPTPADVVGTWEDRRDGLAVGLAAAGRKTGGTAHDAEAGCALAGSIRLDSPGDLRRRLGSPPEAGDAALVLAAYLAWGPACVEQLDGDFAFVVWDSRVRELFGARDRFGVRPFYYATRGGRVAVGSRPRPVLSALGLSRRPDPWRVAELVTETFVDTGRSYFEDVRRLPAGDVLRASASGVHSRAYWRPDRDRQTLDLSPEAAAEAFRDRFDEAVRRRLPAPGEIGAALSGGLDSSSIVVTARALWGSTAPPLPTFTAVYPDFPAADERPFSLAVEAGGGVVPHPVRPDAEHPVAELDAAALGVDEPLYLPTWSMEHATLRAVRDTGLSVYLAGHGGDHVLSTGAEGYFPDLFRSGRWRRLWQEVRALAPEGEAGALVWDLVLKDVIRHALPRPVREARRLPAPAVLRRDVARDLQFSDQVADLTAPLRTAVDRHAAFLYHPPTHDGLERMTHVSGGLGVELRTPFWDRHLVDLCFSVPRDALYRDGVGRRLLRDAMAGRLPEAIRTRRSKASFDPLLNVTLRRYAWDHVQEMVAAPGGMEDWVDLPTVRAAYDRFASVSESDLPSLRSSDSRLLLRVLTLWLWLQRSQPPR